MIPFRHVRRLALALGVALLSAGVLRAEAPAAAPAPVPTPAPLRNPLESKLRMEDAVEENNPFGVVPHRPNYLLPYSHNAAPNQKAFGSQSNGRRLKKAEAKFQLSFRVPLRKDILGRELSLYAAYTQLSYWQVYNSRASAPFRETDYEPEVFLALLTQQDVLGMNARAIFLGAAHQSNGRGTGELSRSWNRLYAEFLLNRGGFVLSLKPWWRIPEADDNNPGIEKFLGYGEVRARYKIGSQVASLMLRNNLRGRGTNKGAVELGWSGPLVRQLRWYVQYFNGYGESLVDYDHASQRAGAGVLFGEWL